MRGAKFGAEAMSRQMEQQTSDAAPSPLAGLVFLICGIGGLFGLISVVDPLL